MFKDNIYLIFLLTYPINFLTHLIYIIDHLIGIFLLVILVII
jgi:hypothetical protein